MKDRTTAPKHSHLTAKVRADVDAALFASDRGLSDGKAVRAVAFMVRELKEINTTLTQANAGYESENDRLRGEIEVIVAKVKDLQNTVKALRGDK